MNVSRLVASVGGYFYSTGEDVVAVHLYGASSARLKVGGRPVAVRQTADYLWSGRIRIAVDPVATVNFALKLRIPAWAHGETLSVNGAQFDTARRERGYVEIRRAWQKGDVVDLDLPMPVERIYSHPDVRMDVGRVALKRGPLVYCVEQADNPSLAIGRLKLPRVAELRSANRPELFDGIVGVEASGRMANAGDWDGNLYRSNPPTEEPAEMSAIPYYLWSNRGQGKMLVWIPEA
jgi:DUF1680 family protein